MSSKRQISKKNTDLVNVMLIGLSYSQQPQTIHTVFVAPAVRMFFTRKRLEAFTEGVECGIN